MIEPASCRPPHLQGRKLSYHTTTMIRTPSQGMKRETRTRHIAIVLTSPRILCQFAHVSIARLDTACFRKA